jgi:diacylglycerol kinase (ATP)
MSQLENISAGAVPALVRVPLLLNEKAGALHSTAGPEQLIQLATASGVDLQVLTTSSPADFRQKVRGLIERGEERIAAAGGDGTIHLAVQELAYSKTALGIIPQGTANNFATALHLPQELPAALRVLAEGAIKNVDLGKVNGEYFTESAGVGLFADALSVYGRSNKNLFRALQAIFKIVLSLKASRVRLTIDGEQVEERSVMCIAANSYRMAYAMPIAPGAKVTDSLLDVIVFGDLKRSELIPYFRAVRAQLHTTLPKVKTMQGSVIKIESYRKMGVHCDDKVITRTPATIEVQPGALKVLVERL